MDPIETVDTKGVQMSENTEESVGKLEGELAVEKVYTQEETRLYRCRAILAFLDDSSVFDMNDSVVSSRDTPIPVENDDGKLLGFATIEVVGDRLLADIAIDYSTPERLVAETRDGERHFARIVGTLFIEDAVFVDVQPSLIKAQELQVDKIVLSTKRPPDARLQAFGELVLV